MSTNLKTIYRAETIYDANLLVNELELHGIHAVATGGEFGSGLLGHSWQSSPWVQVGNDDVEKAKGIVAKFEAQLVGRNERPANQEPESSPDEVWQDWPTCRGCGRRRLARCPACEETSTNFPLADYHERGEEVRALDDAGNVKQAEGDDALPFLLCPHCDETFLATFYRRCAWCSHDAGSGLAPVETREPVRSSALGLYAAIAFVLGLAALLLLWASRLRS